MKKPGASGAAEGQEMARAFFAPPATAAGPVRPMNDSDLPAVARLYDRIFRKGARGAFPPDDYLRRILFRNPWRDARLPSLVHEDRDGRITGCLGVMPRPMLLEGRPIRAAISHTFMMEPDGRSGLGALTLARAFLAGGQDLSIAEGGTPSRRILERLGGAASIVYGLRWTRPLRPARYALSVLGRRGLPSGLGACLAPLCAAADAVAPALARTFVPVARPRLSGRELTIDDLLEGLETVAADRALRPVYDRATLRWLLDLLEDRRERGRLAGVAIVGPGGDLAGWYLHYVRKGRTSEVVQIGARRPFLEDVLDHLFDACRRAGAIAVSGQLDPAAFQALAAKGCFFHSDGASWFLFHAGEPRIASAIQAGDAYLSRLEGEWCIGP